MKSKINFIALVAARLGSKGIKNKNFIKINKKNIVKAAYSNEAVKYLAALKWNIFWIVLVKLIFWKNCK